MKDNLTVENGLNVNFCYQNKYTIQFDAFFYQLSIQGKLKLNINNS